jgi:hypothetical protein
MSSLTTTAAERVDNETELATLANDSEPSQLVNTDSTLPTHHVPPRTHTLPPAFDYHPTHNQMVPSTTNNITTESDEKKTWFNHVKEHAHVVGVVVTIIGVIVAIITVAVK